MKFTIIFFIFFITCSAQSTDDEFTIDDIRTSVEGCSIEEFENTILCGCYAITKGEPQDLELIDLCNSVVGNDLAEWRRACDPYVVNYSPGYDFPGILKSVEFVNDQCIDFEAQPGVGVVRMGIKTSERALPHIVIGFIVLKVLACIPPKIEIVIEENPTPPPTPPPSTTPTPLEIPGSNRIGNKISMLKRNNNLEPLMYGDRQRKNKKRQFLW